MEEVYELTVVRRRTHGKSYSVKGSWKEIRAKMEGEQRSTIADQKKIRKVERY